MACKSFDFQEYNKIPHTLVDKPVKNAQMDSRIVERRRVFLLDLYDILEELEDLYAIRKLKEKSIDPMFPFKH